MDLARERPWRPTSFMQAQADIDRGISENHYLEFKRDSYALTDGGTRELAKDLAAMAVDCGVIVVGVDENKETGRALGLSPVPIKGFAERVDQIAHQRLDPPLHVEIHDPLPDPDDPARGVFVIVIPASPVAPHMVDGRYYGRGERGVRVLPDAEVLRLHQLRAHEQDNFLATLGATAKNMYNMVPVTRGRQVLLAQLSSLSRRPVLRRVFSSRKEWEKLLENHGKVAVERMATTLASMPHLDNLLISSWTPFTEPVSSTRTRQGGIRACGDGWPAYRWALELDEDCTLRFSGNDIVFDGQKNFRSEVPPEFLHWRQLLTATVWLISLLREFVGDAVGSVSIGVHLEGICGVYAEPLLEPDYFGGNRGFRSWAEHPYPDSSYVAATQISAAELNGDLIGALDRLYGQLLRAMNIGEVLLE